MCLINYGKSAQVSKRRGNRKVDFRVDPRIEWLFRPARVRLRNGHRHRFCVAWELLESTPIEGGVSTDTSTPFRHRTLNFTHKGGWFEITVDEKKGFIVKFVNDLGEYTINGNEILELIQDGLRAYFRSSCREIDRKAIEFNKRWGGNYLALINPKDTYYANHYRKCTS